MPQTITNIIGSPVTGHNLFGRERELDRIWERLQAGENLQLLAPRRTGKTSLMLEAVREPRPGWTALHLNVEGNDTPADIVSSLLLLLANEQTTASWLERLSKRLPFTGSLNILNTALERLKSVSVTTIKVELQQAIGPAWPAVFDEFTERLTLVEQDMRLLLAIDELPIPVTRMFRDGDAKAARLLLEKMRALRQRTDLHGRVQFMFAGSIGLNTVLNRYAASATVNDLVPIDVPPWSLETAQQFLDLLGTADRFPIPVEYRDKLLDGLGESVPFHVQLAYAALKDLTESRPDRISDNTVDTAVQKVVEAPQLRHYAERLTLHLSLAENAQCRAILAALSKVAGGRNLTVLSKMLKHDPSELASMLQFLQDEGYLAMDEKSGKLRFRNNLLREYWKRREAAYDGGGYR